jgi:hypothetical protein
MNTNAIALLTAVFAGTACLPLAAAETPAKCAVRFIDTSFENASPLDWSIDEDGAVQIHLMYDHERESPNRAAGHWHFRVEAPAGSDVTLVLNRFENIWNGKAGSPVSKNTVAYVSVDGRQWDVVRPEYLADNRLRLRLTMPADALYVARLEPYRLSDLDRLEQRVARHPLVELTPIGKTVEGRELKMIRIGRDDAPHQVLLRARSHPWEPGGNWVIEGLVARLLKDDADARRWLSRYCVHILPMANKDGVARGRTRFNSRGKDLNRNWNQPADAELAPENRALEEWLERRIAAGRRPSLAIDYHNDEQGKLHLSRPESGADAYLARMQRFEALLRQHTWFTEGSTGANFHNPGTLGEGLWSRYQIPACIHELNANAIAGLEEPASARRWQEFGAQMARVLFDYFEPEAE